MPTTLQEYAGLSYYTDGNPYGSTGRVQGRYLEILIAPLLYGNKLPVEKTLTLESAALADAETLSITAASGTVTLYRGDVLWFNTSDVLAVVKTTTAITTSPTSLPVLPLTGPIADAETTKTYAMVPVRSAQTGGTVENSGTMMTGKNRQEGLFQAQAIQDRSYQLTQLTGNLIVSDDSVSIFESASQSPLPIYWETRYSPFVKFNYEAGATRYQYGEGPGARSGVGYVQTFSLAGGEPEFVGFNAQVVGDGPSSPYVVLGRT